MNGWKIHANPPLERIKVADHWSAIGITLKEAMQRRAVLTIEGRVIAENVQYLIVQTGIAEFHDDTPETTERDVSGYLKGHIIQRKRLERRKRIAK